MKYLQRTCAALCVLALAAAPASAAPAASAATAAGSVTQDSFDRAAAYSESSNGISLLVMLDGRVAFERYSARTGPGFPMELASATKSFCGILACIAVAEGLCTLDEKISGTITEWRSDPRKREITLRQLLTLSSGLKTGNERGNVPTFAQAIAAPMVYAPGERFSYGAVPFQVFGEFLKRKLGGRDPVAYLDEKVFQPIGLRYSRWTRGTDGNPHLSSGAALTARNWAKFGELVRLGGTWQGRVLITERLLSACFEGTAANPAYGLTWWLNRDTSEELRKSIPQLENGTDFMYDESYIPHDLVFAAGSGKQRLYLIPSLGMVIVRQGDRIRESLAGSYASGFSDKEFFRILFGG